MRTTTKIAKTTANKLKKLRKKHGMTLRDFCRSWGLSIGTISRIENGRLKVASKTKKVVQEFVMSN